MYRRILVPIDGSPTARRGLDEALKLARQPGACLRLFHVIDDPYTALGIDDLVEVPKDLATRLEQNARRIIEEGKTVARAAGVEAEAEIEDRSHGSLWDLVAEAALRSQSDLIVLGTHGRRGVTRMLLGSDAERILRVAPVPVLTVHGEEGE
jgi:nucleotide-binding universal stress UspA family protein